MIARPMRTTIWLIMLALLMGGCTQDVSESPLRIGATLALTGQLAELGINEQRGLQLAVEEMNDRGGILGRPVELIVEDNKGDAKEAITTVNKLLNQDDVDLLISAFTHITLAIKQPVAESGKMMIYASVVPTVAQENQGVFRDYWDGHDAGSMIADVMRSRGYDSYKFIGENSEVCQSFQSGVKSKGLKSIREEHFLPTDTELRTPLLKLQLKSTDALLVCAIRNEPLLMKGMEELDLLKTQTFHLEAPFLSAADTPEMRTIYEKNDAVSHWWGFAEVVSDESQKKFIDAYEKKFEEKAKPDAGYFYDDLLFFKQAVESCKELDKACVENYMIKNTYEGVTGTLDYDESRVARRETFPIQVINGTWVRAN